MKTKRIVGVAIILFCVALLLIYTFGFMLDPNKSSNQNLIAKKEDLSVVSTINKTSASSETTNKTSTTTQKNQTQTSSGTQSTATQTTTTTPTVRNTGRTTSAS